MKTEKINVKVTMIDHFKINEIMDTASQFIEKGKKHENLLANFLNVYKKINFKRETRKGALHEQPVTMTGKSKDFAMLSQIIKEMDNGYPSFVPNSISDLCDGEKKWCKEIKNWNSEAIQQIVIDGSAEYYRTIPTDIKEKIKLIEECRLGCVGLLEIYPKLKVSLSKPDQYNSGNATIEGSSADIQKFSNLSEFYQHLQGLLLFGDVAKILDIAKDINKIKEDERFNKLYGRG